MAHRGLHLSYSAIKRYRRHSYQRYGPPGFHVLQKVNLEQLQSSLPCRPPERLAADARAFRRPLVSGR
jgi:hypothetical protein